MSADTGTVTIVDDDDAVRLALTMSLRARGYEVRDYEAAGPFLSDYEPGTGGCLVLDIRMPDMDGFALHAELMKRGATPPIIFVTGRNDGRQPVEFDPSVVQFLEKPFKTSTLIARIEALLRR